MPRKSQEFSHSSPRPTWSGNLNLGLVSIAVEAFNALDRKESDIHFHQLHAKCHSRIHYDKVCPKHGKITNEEIVSGYEFRKGEYVEFNPEELDELRSESDKAFKIDAFVSPEGVDPLYFDGRMYYLVPAGKSSEEAFDLVIAAMKKEGRYGIGQIVLSGKDQIALIRPMAGVFHMAMLNYSKEIRSPDKKRREATKTASAARQLKLAQSVIQQWSEKNFDFSEYEDHYRERVEKLIEAKIKGKKIATPTEAKAVPATLNLMDALKKSLSHPGPQKSRSQKSRTAHSA